MMAKKEQYFDRQKKRIAQRAMLLIENAEFQKRVNEIRVMWNIPLEGLKSNEESEIWHGEFYKLEETQAASIISKNRDELIKLKENGKYKEAKNFNDKLVREFPLNKFRIQIKKIIRDFKIPLHWFDGIKRYVLFNNVDLMHVRTNISVQTEQDKDVFIPKMSISISSDTTLNDIKQNWFWIKEHQKRLNSHTKEKFQPLKKFERNKRAYILYKQGETYKDIASILSEEFDEDVFYDDVPKYIERYLSVVDIN